MPRYPKMTHLPAALGGTTPAARPLSHGHAHGDVLLTRPLPGRPIESRAYTLRPGANAALPYRDVTPSVIGAATTLSCTVGQPTARAVAALLAEEDRGCAT